MKNLLLIFCITVFSQHLEAQTQPAPLVWGSSANQDSIWALDTTSWLPVINIEPLVTGSVIAGINGMAYDPTTYKSYVIIKDNSSNTRYLAEISLQTGSCTVKGDLGDKFSSISFDKFGQLYGSTGDGATVPESLYKIDKATATSTLVFAMGNGNDGELICYNRYDNKMYHWSGNGTVVYESWPLASTAYTPANIALSGTPGNESFGALCIGPGSFVISNISSSCAYLSTTGYYSNSVSSNPDGLRGLIMPPRFALGSATICANTDSAELYSNCLQLYDSVYYNWGDGNLNQILATSASTAASVHSYSASGVYTITVQLFNGAVPKSTFTTFTVLVSTSPSVSLSGSTNLCPGGTITLTGTGGGSSQWYNSGVAVPGATLNTLHVTNAGWYNMIKTNQSGCADSSNTGILVTLASNPTIAVSNTAICVGTSYTISPTGAISYSISGGSFAVSPTVTSSYSVTGTNSAGCVSSVPAIATITVNALPSLSLSTTNATLCVGETATLTANGATSYTWISAGTAANTLTINPIVSTTYSVSGTSSNGCSATESITQEVSECTGLSENKIMNKNIRVMPNPSNGKFSVTNVSENNSIEVYDMLGQLILKSNAHECRTDLSISSTPAGIYFVRVIENTKVVTQIKLIKE